MILLSVEAASFLYVLAVVSPQEGQRSSTASDRISLLLYSDPGYVCVTMCMCVCVSVCVCVCVLKCVGGSRMVRQTIQLT